MGDSFPFSRRCLCDDLMKPLSVFVVLSLCTFGSLGAQSAISVTEFGAVPDDGIPDTEAFQSAIGAAATTGAILHVPAGQFLLGSIELTPGLDLYLAPGATLRASTDLADYPPYSYQTATGEMNEVQALIIANESDSITIRGSGRILGEGESFWDDGFLESGKGRPTLPRPRYLLFLHRVENLRIVDVTLAACPQFGIGLRESSHVLVEGINIFNDPRSPNTDGVQIIDSNEIMIRDSRIVTGDDAIVFKPRKLPIRNVTISGCHLTSDDAAVKFGTSSHSLVENILVTDCLITETRYGIALFMLDGGIHRNTIFSNLRIANGGRHGRTYAIFVDIDRRSPESALGEVSNIRFEEIDITTTGNLLIAGNRAQTIRQLTLRSISITVAEDAFDLRQTSQKPRGNRNLSIGETSDDYSRKPATLTLANIEGLLLEDITVSHPREIPRQGLFLENVSELTVSRFQSHSGR